MKTKVFLVSLGCSKNHCDLENMMGIMTNAGYEIALNENEADVALINTCGFIDSAKTEAIDFIYRFCALFSCDRFPCPQNGLHRSGQQESF